MRERRESVTSSTVPIGVIDSRQVNASSSHVRSVELEVGEIVISAPQLMTGYWNRPDETLEMLRTDERGERVLYIGDLGYMDDDGYIFIVDHSQIRWDSFRPWLYVEGRFVTGELSKRRRIGGLYARSNR